MWNIFIIFCRIVNDTTALFNEERLLGSRLPQSLNMILIWADEGMDLVKVVVHIMPKTGQAGSLIDSN